MITLSNIKKNYQNKRIFDNFNLELEEGKITCIIGPSGSGKTTLLNILSNRVSYEGETKGIPSKISYIFQENRLLDKLSVLDNFKFVNDNIDEKELEHILDKLEIKNHLNDKVLNLSGGEARRVSIARSLLVSSDLILSDEATSSLDTGLKIKLAKFFLDYQKCYNKTILYVTHDIEEALMLGNRIIVLDQGHIVLDSINNKSEYLGENSLRDELIKTMISISK